MKTEDFYFDLPDELIAQTPLLNREKSRMMVLDKESGEITHKTFENILEYINSGDCLVINETKVIPARLYGKRKTGGVVELLLLKRIDLTKWETLVKPGRNARVSEVITFSDSLQGEIIEVLEDGNRIIEFKYDGVFENILDELGQMPLPPYIVEKLEDKTRYQTVYAKNEGSAAAPTAGLHFTNDIIKKLEDKGVKIARLTLHVGLGTFRPVQVTDTKDHKMHVEEYIVTKECADIINECKKNGGKVFSVGTTSCRTLETVADENGFIVPSSGATDIFIYPPYKFKVVDALITNFHLPESTLIMLVSALSSKENVLNAYNVAVSEKYRFFSFGDCMLIK